METTQDNNGPSPAFIRATLKIAHPEWSTAQIESELQRKMAELKRSSSGNDCEFCSS